MEQVKIMIFTAAEVACRRERGLKLNYPEAVADLMSFGATILGRDDGMEGVPEMVDEVAIEATFPDGTKLVTVHDPIV